MIQDAYLHTNMQPFELKSSFFVSFHRSAPNIMDSFIRADLLVMFPKIIYMQNTCDMGIARVVRIICRMSAIECGRNLNLNRIRIENEDNTTNKRRKMKRILSAGNSRKLPIRA